MSTTFEVYAKNIYIPSFKEVLISSEMYINQYLRLHNINLNVCIECELKSQSRSKSKLSGLKPQTIKIDENKPFSWNEDYYLWIQINGIEGVDAYMKDVEESYIEELYESANTSEKLQCVNEAVKQKYFWQFRRSAGQAAIINIAYGFIAGTLAKLTEGIVYSGDCGWDPSMLPAKGDDFLMFYMEPEKTQDKDYKERALECISSLTP